MADQYLRLESEGVDSMLLLKDTGQVDAGGHPIVRVSTESNGSVGQSIPAGEEHIGSVGSDSANPSFNPVLTNAGAYHVNDYVGTSGTTTPITAARKNAGKGWVISARLIDKQSRNASIELWLFNAAITPPADNAAWDVSDADMQKLVGVIPFNTYYATASNSAAPGAPIAPALFACPAGVMTVYPYFVTRTAVTWASLDLTAIFSILQD